LPPNERSVRDLEGIERRTDVLGLVLCAVVSDDPALRSKGAQLLADRIRKLDPSLVADVVSDDGIGRRYVWEHRFLFAPLADLEAARDALKSRIGRAKLRANPLYVSLGDSDEDEGGGHGDDRLEKLRAQMRDAGEKVKHPDEIVSKDGRVQLLIVQA